MIGLVITTSTGCSVKESELAHDVMDTVKEKAKNFAEEKWADIEEWATEDDGYVDPETEKMLKQASVVMKAFQSNDEESLFMLFNEYMRKNYKEDLERDIKGAFDFVDGEVLSYDDPMILPSTRETDEDGVVKNAHEIWIENICTDTGKKYEIKYTSYDVNKRHSDGIGIDWFAVIDSEMAEKEEDDSLDDVYTFGEYGDTYDAVINR